MAFKKYSTLNILKNITEIDQEIFLLKKNLFDLRMKRSINQKVNVHLFIHYKRQIAQLNFKRSSWLKISNSLY